MESVPIFPPPPAYSILFARNETEKTSPEQDTAQLPLAPPEPIQGQHVIFGELQEGQPGIPKLTVQHLFDEAQPDFKGDLHRLHTEVLETYAELAKTVVQHPERYARLTERVGVLIRNMIQLVNLMRPYQAVGSLHQFLERGIQLRQTALLEIAQCKEDCVKLLNERLHSIADANGSKTEENETFAFR